MHAPFRTGPLNFNEKRLARAIAIREKRYRFLLWIGEAIDRKRIQPIGVTHPSSGPEAVKAWIETYHRFIPSELRPSKRDTREFAAFFSTYITSSFDVGDYEQKINALGPGWCHCDLCVRIVHASRLKTKKVYAADKRHANRLMLECIRDLADRNGFQLSYEQSDEIILQEKTRRSAAYLTYGHWLIRRLEGESEGPAILALWRIIAWDPRGGVRRGFELKLQDFKDAKRKVLAAMKGFQIET